MEFRPLPGQEDDWAEFNYIDRGGAWYWLGVFPIGAYWVLLLLLIGMVFSGS